MQTKSLHLPKRAFVKRDSATGIARGAVPVKVYPPPARNIHYFRDDPKYHGRGDGLITLTALRPICVM